MDNKITVKEFAERTEMTVANVHAKFGKTIEPDTVDLPGGRTQYMIDIEKYPIEDFGRVRAKGGGRKK